MRRWPRHKEHHRERARSDKRGANKYGAERHGSYSVDEILQIHPYELSPVQRIFPSPAHRLSALVRKHWGDAWDEGAPKDDRHGRRETPYQREEARLVRGAYLKRQTPIGLRPGIGAVRKTRLTV